MIIVLFIRIVLRWLRVRFATISSRHLASWYAGARTIFPHPIEVLGSREPFFSLADARPTNEADGGHEEREIRPFLSGGGELDTTEKPSAVTTGSSVLDPW